MSMTSELSASDVALLSGRNSNQNGDGFFGGNGAYWIIILSSSFSAAGAITDAIPLLTFRRGAARPSASRIPLAWILTCRTQT